MIYLFTYLLSYAACLLCSLCGAVEVRVCAANDPIHHHLLLLIPTNERKAKELTPHTTTIHSTRLPSPPRHGTRSPPPLPSTTQHGTTRASPPLPPPPLHDDVNSPLPRRARVGGRVLQPLRCLGGGAPGRVGYHGTYARTHAGLSCVGGSVCVVFVVCVCVCVVCITRSLPLSLPPHTCI